MAGRRDGNFCVMVFNLFNLIYLICFRYVFYSSPLTFNSVLSTGTKTFFFAFILVSSSGADISIPVSEDSRELQQPRRLRQIKRHLKTNICPAGTILRLLLCAGILYS